MSAAPARGLRDEARVGARRFKGKRGRCVAACWPAGAEQSVLKVVGANAEDRQNVVVASRLSPASFSISHVIPW